MRNLLKAAIGTALCLLTLTVPASAQFLTFVSAAGNDANTCFVQAAPCKTLQRAINQTNAGGEVRLLSSLVSNGFINKSITIEGGRYTVVGTIAVNNASAIVRFRRLNLNGINGFPIGFNLINAAAVHIENCSVERYADDGIALAANVSTELSIADSVIRDNADEGLLTLGPTTAKVSIDNSRFENNAGTGTLLVAQTSVSRSIAFGNFIGFDVGGAASATIADSVAAANVDIGFGVFDAGGTSLTLSSCDAYQHNNQGLLVGGIGGPTARISNCVFTANGEGVGNNSTALTRANNLIAGNTTNLVGALTPLAGE